MRESIELIPVESMDEVFSIALHRVILPQRVGDTFVIEVEVEADEDDDGAEKKPAAAKGAEE